MLVGTVHLESSDSAETRKKQLQMAINVLQTCQNNVLLGDFNFHSTWTDQQAKIAENGYLEVFLELNKEEDYTMAKTNRYAKWRPDKIIMPSKGMTIAPSDIQIVGKFCIPEFQNDEYTKVSEDGIIRTPSDHMALLANFNFIH